MRGGMMGESGEWNGVLLLILSPVSEGGTA